jgi:hypothetical protein
MDSFKIKIQNRSVYHKFVEVEIEVSKDAYADWKLEYGATGFIQDFLLDNEEMYSNKIDNALSKAEYVHGTGLYDFKGMDDAETDSEWRYENERGEGGHL